MDHMKDPTKPHTQQPDMRHLTQPRGKGYSFRMVTPDVLVGEMNPWTNKPFGKEIKIGLKTRRHADAVRQRDVRLGQIRQLEDEATHNKGNQGAGRVLELSHESATEWRDMREATDASPALDFVLADKLERAEVDGQGEEARRFANFVFRGAIPLSKAMEEYLEERSEGNSFGNDPLATTTALNRDRSKAAPRVPGKV